MSSNRAVKPLLILGASDFATEVADLAEATRGQPVAAFVENVDRSRCRQTLAGHPIIWIDELRDLIASHEVVCGLGTTHRASYIAQVADLGATFATLVHPTARVSTKTAIAERCVVNGGVIIGAHTRFGRHVVVNRGALIGHHTEVDDFASIMPGANIAGSCRIGSRAYVGMSAIVIDHTTVGQRAVVGAGALVIDDIPDRCLAYGAPARVMKTDIDGK